MSWLKRKKENRGIIVRCTVPDKELNEFQRTDVVTNMNGVPFLTLTESKMPNTWYHDELPFLFHLTSKGFRIHRGTKEGLFKRGLERILTDEK